MIVVADTSPLNYLILIGVTEILPSLYGRVIVPATVARELEHEGSPPLVRTWMAHIPAWLEVRSDPVSDPALAYLDSGERAALALVQLLKADTLLINDRIGRREAKRRHIPVTGTLGVLADAHKAGLVDFGGTSSHDEFSSRPGHREARQTAYIRGLKASPIMPRA